MIMAFPSAYSTKSITTEYCIHAVPTGHSTAAYIHVHRLIKCISVCIFLIETSAMLHMTLGLHTIN
jgi:hypothetical protein